MCKRLLLAVLAAALVLASGCGGAKNAAIAEEDFALVIDSHSFRCMTDIAEVLAVMGEDYQYAEGKSCAYDGLDKSFIYPAAEFYTVPLQSGDTVSEIYTGDQSSATARGVRVGNTRQQVIDAYGEPQEEQSGLMIYRRSQQQGGPALCFELDGETVSAFFVTVEQV